MQDNILPAISKTHYTSQFPGTHLAYASDTLWMVLFQGPHTSIPPILSHPKSIDRAKGKAKKAESCSTER